jgi:hypothetical protein
MYFGIEISIRNPKKPSKNGKIRSTRKERKNISKWAAGV